MPVNGKADASPALPVGNGAAAPPVATQNGNGSHGAHANGSNGTHPPAAGQPAAIENDLRRALAQASAREAALQERLRQTSVALLEANRQLAQVPLLRHRLGERDAEYLLLLGSRSWRLTAFARRLRAWFGPRR